MSDEFESGGMRPPVTPREVVDALDLIIRWYREDKTGENWRVDVQQMESDRGSMAELIEAGLTPPTPVDHVRAGSVDCPPYCYSKRRPGYACDCKPSVYADGAVAEAAVFAEFSAELATFDGRSFPACGHKTRQLAVRAGARALKQCLELDARAREAGR